MKALVTTLAVLAILANVAVAWLRVQSAEATAVGGAVHQTSGCEIESAFNIWRAAQGQPVYGDSSRMPFAGAYFNWLFYSSYGAIARTFAAVDDTAELYRVARRFTAVGAVFGTFAITGLLVCINRPAGSSRATLAAAMGVSVFFGALPGWWVITARPDIWGLALEAAGVVWFLAWHRRTPMSAVVGAAVLFYLAWSFKQTFVAGPAAVGLFLMFHRSWRDVAVLVCIMGASVGLTMFLMGPSYRFGLSETVAATGFEASIGRGNAVSAASKLLWLLLAVPLVWHAARVDLLARENRSLRQDALQVGLLGTFIGLAIFAPSASKVGAATNYYFSPALMLSLAVSAALPAATKERYILPSALAMLALPLAVLLGYAGRTSLADDAGALAQRWAMWKDQPSPRFSSDLSLNMPQPGDTSPAFVLGFNYQADRARGRPFEANGIGGLIEQGYFASLLLPADTRGRYDGGSLERYVRNEEVAGLALYRRLPIESE